MRVFWLLLVGSPGLAASPQLPPGATTLPDSLRQLLAHTPPDSTRLALFDMLGARHYHQPFFPALMQQGTALARRLGNRPAESQFLLQQANYAIKRDDLVRAVPFCQRVLRLAAEGGLAGKSYAARAELALAAIAESEDDHRSTARHAARAVSYARQMDSTNLNKPITQGTALLLVLKASSIAVKKAQAPDSLRVLLHRHLPEMRRVLQQLAGQGDSTNFLGLSGRLALLRSDAYQVGGQPDSALAAANQAVQLFERAGWLSNYLTGQGQAAEFEIELHRPAAAIVRLRPLLPLFRQVALPLVEADVLSTYGGALGAVGEWQPAWRATARALSLRDSVLAQDKRRTLALLATRFGAERREARIRQLTTAAELTKLRTARRQELTLTLAVLALVVLGGTFGYLRQRAAAARREAELHLRARLAADLHDEVGALLTRVSLFAELAQETPEPALLNELLTESRSAAATVRDIIWSVDTTADTLGALADRLHDMLDQARRASGWDTHFALVPPTANPATPLTPAMRQHLYLIGREAVTNALKHGPAQAILSLTLTVESAGRLTLSVQHDGLAPAAGTAAPIARAGQGVRNIHTRAAALGGRVEQCGPAPTGGWVVRVAVG